MGCIPLTIILLFRQVKPYYANYLKQDNLRFSIQIIQQTLCWVNFLPYYFDYCEI